MTAVHVGSRIRMRRTSLDLSQGALADATEIPLAALEMYETGESRIHARDLYRIARYFDVPVAWFFDGLERVADILIGSTIESNGNDCQQVLEQDSRELLDIYVTHIHNPQHLLDLVELARLFAEREAATRRVAAG